MTSPKRLLWAAVGGKFNPDGTHVEGSGNTYLITIAASNIGEPIPGGDYEKIRREVERLKSLSLQRRVAAADISFNPRRE